VLCVGHLDQDEQFNLDLLKLDIGFDDGVKLLARYGLACVSHDDQDLYGYPIAQALNAVYAVLRAPPPPTPIYWSTWRHQLAFARYQDIADAHARKWHACWKGGKQIAELLMTPRSLSDIWKKRRPRSAMMI
jgi:hypothetical protein